MRSDEEEKMRKLGLLYIASPHHGGRQAGFVGQMKKFSFSLVCKLNFLIVSKQNPLFEIF